MQKYTVDEILKGINNNDNRVLSYIYNTFFHEIFHFVSKNSGNEDDAKDLFQESLIIIFRQSKHNGLNLECEFKTYLFSICKNQWLKHLKKLRTTNKNTVELEDTIELEDNITETFEEHDRYRLYQKHFKQLGEDCRQILRMYISGCSFKQITNEMGYKSENYAKKKKYFCKEYLINSIKKDPNYKEVIG